MRSLEDLDRIRALGCGHVDATIGSALDIFGGPLPYAKVLEWHRDQLDAKEGERKRHKTESAPAVGDEN